MEVMSFSCAAATAAWLMLIVGVCKCIEQECFGRFKYLKDGLLLRESR